LRNCCFCREISNPRGTINEPIRGNSWPVGGALALFIRETVADVRAHVFRPKSKLGSMKNSVAEYLEHEMRFVLATGALFGYPFGAFLLWMFGFYGSVGWWLGAGSRWQVRSRCQPKAGHNDNCEFGRQRHYERRFAGQNHSRARCIKGRSATPLWAFPNSDASNLPNL
jgi:hypothetical protein